MVHESHRMISHVTKLYQMELLVIVNVKEDTGKWRKTAVQGLSILAMMRAV